MSLYMYILAAGIGSTGPCHIARLNPEPHPNPNLNPKQALQALGLQGRGGIIGLHVRHGDACVHAAQSNTRPLCRPFSEYLPGVREMRDRYNARTVFLSTDDAHVASAAPAILRLVHTHTHTHTYTHTHIHTHTYTHTHTHTWRGCDRRGCER